jgi:hypothetical protein
MSLDDGGAQKKSKAEKRAENRKRKDAILLEIHYKIPQ